MDGKGTPVLDRRQFIAGVGAVMVPSGLQQLRLRKRGSSPNERVTFAGIGVGSRGGNDVDECVAEGAQCIALCDVDHKYAEKELAKYPDATRFVDYKEMLDKLGDKVDSVVIGTPDHTHAVIAMEAMKRGKHVYCEKPLTHTIHEARAIMAAAKKYGVVTQLGNQGHSTDTIRKTCEWIWAGAIGNVHTVHAACGEFKEVYSQIGNLPKLSQHFDAPASLNYEKWLGPTQYRPYTPFWVHWNWRGWMPFGTGTIGDWICHVVDPSFWALDLGGPTSVHAEVSGYDPAVHGLTYPPATKITFDFPANKKRGPVKLVWFDGNNPLPTPADLPKDDAVPRTGAIIMGDKGMIVHGSHGAGGCHLQPDAVREKWSGANAPKKTIERVKNHHSDWLEAIKAGRQAGSNFDYGARLTQIALLGAIAIKFPGQTLNWDDKAARFTNNTAANAWVNPPYRAGWKLG